MLAAICSLPLPLLFTDENGMIIQANYRAHILFGQKVSSLAGVHVRLLLSDPACLGPDNNLPPQLWGVAGAGSDAGRRRKRRIHTLTLLCHRKRSWWRYRENNPGGFSRITVCLLSGIVEQIKKVRNSLLQEKRVSSEILRPLHSVRRSCMRQPGGTVRHHLPGLL